MKDIDELSDEERRLAHLVRMSHRREAATPPDVDKAWDDFRRSHVAPSSPRRGYSAGHLVVAALAGADKVTVVKTYPARETPDQGMDGLELSRRVSLRKRCGYVKSLMAVASDIALTAREGDFIILTGAGDIDLVRYLI